MNENTNEEDIVKKFKILLAINRLTSELVLESETFICNLPHTPSTHSIIDRLTNAFEARKEATRRLEAVYKLQSTDIKRFLTDYGRVIAQEINSFTYVSEKEFP